eukprot:299678-Rhodomonas_salina.2
MPASSSLIQLASQCCYPLTSGKCMRPLLTAAIACDLQAKIVADPTIQDPSSKALRSEPTNTDLDKSVNQDEPIKPIIKPAGSNERPSDDRDSSAGVGLDGQGSKRVSICTSIHHQTKELPPVPAPTRTDSLVNFVVSVTGKQTPLASARYHSLCSGRSSLARINASAHGYQHGLTLSHAAREM